MSAAAPVEADVPSPPARRPATPTRFALLLLAALGTAVVFAVGFPPGAPDRAPVLLLALALAIDAVLRPARAIRDFGFAFPLAGLLAVVSGSTDPVAWPVVLFGGFAVGWTFRFLYDFDSRPDPTRLDGPLRALTVVWGIGTLLALVHARTLWAMARGLRGRAVNSSGLPETAAIRETLVTFAALAAGAGLYFLLRRSGEPARTEAVRAVVVATAISAAAAILQALQVLPADPRPFWRMTGRFPGASTDPNALGLLCGVAIPLALSFALSASRPRWAFPCLLVLPAGLVLSGSRSGFLVAAVGALAVMLASRGERRVRSLLALALAAAIAVVAGAALLRGSPGDVGERLGHLFRSSLPLDDRTSSRPLLWRAAFRQFASSPVAGGGLGSFGWRLPDLAGADGPSLSMRDNPGSAYLQALAETGVVGLLLTLLFAGALTAHAVARLRARAATGSPASAGAAAAILVFLLALVVGSHWLSPDVSLAFFLLAAVVAVSTDPAEHPPLGRSRILRGVVVAALALFAGFALRSALATRDPAVTFRSGGLIGFYGPEVGPSGSFRWTRRKFAVWVEPGEPYRLSLTNSSPENRPVDVTISARGRALRRRALRPGEIVALALRAGGRSGPIEFEVSRSFVPKRFGLPDRRELGLVAVTPDDLSAP